MSTADDALFQQHAHSFGSAADAYERGRPGYPVEAARWLVPAGAASVADVGAGTGKFTRALTSVVDEVVAVEPDDDMRARLERAVPGVRAVAGSGESIPLPDASVDAVTFAQAWHWVDSAAGSAEAWRVLRPGGNLGLVWNIRDEDVPWVRRLSEILDRPESHVFAAEEPDVTAPFDPAAMEHETFRWVDEQTREQFVDMVASRSYVIVLPAAERAALIAEVEDLVESEFGKHGSVPVPYTTHAHRITKH
jgi:SAM-dependent methyltransferase